VVNPAKLPVADFKAFLERVRSSPGRFNYGSAGGGTSHHLAGKLFKQQSKTFITHIPYRGAGAALQGLIQYCSFKQFRNWLMPLIQQLAAVAHAVAAHLALDATRVEFATAADAQSLTDLLKQCVSQRSQTLRGE